MILDMKIDGVVREAGKDKDRALYCVKEADTGHMVHGSFQRRCSCP